MTHNKLTSTYDAAGACVLLLNEAKDFTLIPLLHKSLVVEGGGRWGKSGLVIICLQLHLGVPDLYLEHTHLVLPLEDTFDIMHGHQCIHWIAF